MIRSHVLICGGTGCTSSGSVTLRDKLAEELKAKAIYVTKEEENGVWEALNALGFVE